MVQPTIAIRERPPKVIESQDSKITPVGVLLFHVLKI
uniref:Uncharacterized protein n=1 Tax=Heterorhabditis bacteriophora TaxID=37862 RepID=A0A1I7WSA0_HETBA